MKAEKLQKQNYAIAVHEAGHTVAAYALGFGMTKKGALVYDIGDGLFGGWAYPHEVGLHCQNLKKREFFLKQHIVLSFAGPVAENRVRPALQVYSDSFRIGLALCELMPNQKQFFGECDANNPYWNDLQSVVNSQAACLEREEALAELHEWYGDSDWNIDLMQFFNMLWPLAEKAHSLITTHWSSIQTLATDLLKVRHPSRNEIEARLPWAGNIVIC